MDIRVFYFLALVCCVSSRVTLIHQPSLHMDMPLSGFANRFQAQTQFTDYTIGRMFHLATRQRDEELVQHTNLGMYEAEAR